MFETNRQSIKHLEDLSPSDFIKLLDDLPNIKVTDIVTREKIDGSSIRFGFMDNKFFVETSYSGPFKPGDYLKAIKAKYGYDPSDFSYKFNELSIFLSNQNSIKKILQPYGNIKVIAEVLYNPLATPQELNTLKFVHISYDKSKLGKIATLIPIQVINEKGILPNQDKIIDDLIDHSTSDFKIISNKIHLNLDILFQLDDIKSLLKNYNNIEYYLKSRKKSDLTFKNAIISIIDQAKKKIADYIKKQKITLLGNDSEGYILELPGLKGNLKITTDKFKDLMIKDKSKFLKKEGFLKMNRKLLGEGGNAIPSSIPIKREYIEPTLNYVYRNFLEPLIHISKNDTALLGSTGKKPISGDIDLGVDLRSIIKNNNSVDTLEDVLNFFASKAKSFFPNVKFNKGINVISVGCEIRDERGNLLDHEELCQIDFMLSDNLDFATFIYHSPTAMESKFKGLYRNLLLFSILKFSSLNVIRKVGNTPVEWERYFIDMNMGLKKMVQEIPFKKNGVDLAANYKTKGTYPVTNDVETIMQIIFGKNIDSNDIDTFEKLYHLIITNKDFEFRDKLPEIFKLTAKGIKQSGYPIPKELKSFI